MVTTSSDLPVPYMERTRHYYRALGYERDYVWATFADVPFTRLRKPLAEAKIALVTTASPPDRSNIDDLNVRHVWSGLVAEAPEHLSTDNLAWDRESTHTRDRGSYFPIEVAAELACDSVFAGLAAHFHGVPTEYSQRKTLAIDAPQVLTRLRADGADAAILCAL